MGKGLNSLHRLARQYALRVLDAAGITLNGSQPWDIQVHDERLYLRCLLYGSPRRGNTPAASTSSLMVGSCFQFLGIPPKGELPAFAAGGQILCL